MTLRSSRQSSQVTQQVLSKSSPLQRSVEIAGNVGIPLASLTQEDQDNADEEKQRKSMHTLVQTWLDSLQLISVITTFFVANEVSWLAITVPSHDHGSLSRAGQLANIGISSALIVHGHAAIISFLAAFCLIRYKLTVAQKEEEKIEENLVDSPKPMSLSDPEKARGFQTTTPCADLRPARRPVRVNSSPLGDKVIWSTNPHLVQVGPFQGRPPTELLARCYFLSVILFCVGFLLALVGGISFAWDRFPRSIGISSSISTILCLATVISIVVVPSTQTSHIFYYKSR